MSYDWVIKLILTGDSGSGKSCLLTRFTDHAYIGNYISTIGVDFKIRTLDINGKNVKLQIWDTAGQERFKSIVSSYYRGAEGVLLAFDLSNMESFNNIQQWSDDIKKITLDSTKFLLVGCKSDLDRAVQGNLITDFCTENDMPYASCSAAKDKGVNEVFMTLASLVMDKPFALNSRDVGLNNGGLNIRKRIADSGCCLLS